MSFSYATFDEISARLAEARKWFESIGITTAGSRLELLQAKLAQLLEDLPRLPPEEAVAKWGELDTYWALADARAFCEIAEQLRTVPSHLLPRRKLTTILTGPLDPLEENPADVSVQARNFLAEIELAADLAERGLKPTGFDDLRVSFQGRDLWFECKRIHSHGQVSTHVGKAESKLSKDIPDADSRGVIVIVLDRLSGVDRLVLRVEQEVESQREVVKLVDEFLKQHTAVFQAKSERRIISVAFVIHFLLYSTRRNLVSTSYTLVLVPWDIAEQRDRDLLEELACYLAEKSPERDLPAPASGA